MSLSAVSTILCFRLVWSLVNILNKSSCIDGPAIKAPLSESPVEVFAETFCQILSVDFSSGYLLFAQHGEADNIVRYYILSNLYHLPQGLVFRVLCTRYCSPWIGLRAHERSQEWKRPSKSRIHLTHESWYWQVIELCIGRCEGRVVCFEHNPSNTISPPPRVSEFAVIPRPLRIWLIIRGLHLLSRNTWLVLLHARLALRSSQQGFLKY